MTLPSKAQSGVRIVGPNKKYLPRSSVIASAAAVAATPTISAVVATEPVTAIPSSTASVATSSTAITIAREVTGFSARIAAHVGVERTPETTAARAWQCLANSHSSSAESSETFVSVSIAYDYGQIFFFGRQLTSRSFRVQPLLHPLYRRTQ